MGNGKRKTEGRGMEIELVYCRMLYDYRQRTWNYSVHCNERIKACYKEWMIVIIVACRCLSSGCKPGSKIHIFQDKLTKYPSVSLLMINIVCLLQDNGRISLGCVLHSNAHCNWIHLPKAALRHWAYCQSPIGNGHQASNLIQNHTVFIRKIVDSLHHFRTVFIHQTTQSALNFTYMHRPKTSQKLTWT